MLRTGLFAVVLLLGAGLTALLWVHPVDQQILDAQFRFLRAHAPHPVQTDVVIVGIDDETTRALREPITLWHPHLRGHGIARARGRRGADGGADLRAQAESLRPPANAPLSTRIAYAAWLNGAELKDEARKYWKDAAAERPDDARLKALAEQ